MRYTELHRRFTHRQKGNFPSHWPSERAFTLRYWSPGFQWTLTRLVLRFTLIQEVKCFTFSRWWHHKFQHACSMRCKMNTNAPGLIRNIWEQTHSDSNLSKRAQCKNPPSVWGKRELASHWKILSLILLLQKKISFLIKWIVFFIFFLF